MKKKATELTLSRETLRNLSFSELNQAAGQGVYSDICRDPNTFKQVWYNTSAACAN
jgi:hypothetical protein